MMDKLSAMELVRSKVENQNLRNHMLAVAAILKKLATRFGEPEQIWEMAGLVHDIDLGTTTDPETHGRLGASWLKELDFEPEICQAVLAHAGHAPGQSRLDTAICAADQISGLIVACALVKGKKLANVSVNTVQKQFKEKRFAAGADRNAIMKCREIGLELPEFISISLESMQEISDNIGL